MTAADKIAAIDKLIGLYEMRTTTYNDEFPLICCDLANILRNTFFASHVKEEFEMKQFEPVGFGPLDPWFEYGDFTSRIELLKKMKTNLLNK